MDGVDPFLSLESPAAEELLSTQMPSTLSVRAQPEELAGPVLEKVTLVVVFGDKRAETLQAACQAMGEDSPQIPALRPAREAGLAWRRGTPAASYLFLAAAGLDATRVVKRSTTEVLNPEHPAGEAPVASVSLAFHRNSFSLRGR